MRAKETCLDLHGCGGGYLLFLFSGPFCLLFLQAGCLCLPFLNLSTGLQAATKMSVQPGKLQIYIISRFLGVFKTRDIEVPHW